MLLILEHYGIRGTVNALLRSYLSGRSQCVVVGDARSSELPMAKGVPQGSVLGPLLFNLFINDIVNVFSVQTILFADDGVFYCEAPTFDEALTHIRTFITKLEKWLTASKLLPNEEKTKLMLLTPRPRPQLPDVFFNCKKLEWVRSFKYLGTIIDDGLQFKAHVGDVVSKLSKARGAIYAASKTLPRTALLTLYYSLVYPYLTGSIVLWGGAPEATIRPVATLMNKVLRIILAVRFDVNRIPLMRTIPMYSKLRLLRFEHVYEYFIIKFFRFALYEDIDLFNKLYAPLLPTHQYATCNNRLNLPPVRVDVQRRSVVFQSVVAARGLLAPISKLTFKNNYKKMILTSYSTR